MLPSVGRTTLNLKVMGSTLSQVPLCSNLGILFAPMDLRHQTVKLGTGLTAVGMYLIGIYTIRLELDSGRIVESAIRNLPDTGY